MKDKCMVFVVLSVFLVLAPNSVSQVVGTRDIDVVRNKSVLDDRDLQVIDKFVAEAVQELLDTEDFTSVSKIRTVILSRSSSATDSAAGQYKQQFSDSVYRRISSGLKKADELTPEERKLKAVLNLLLLINDLEDLRLTELAIRMLNSENSVIRYWAVHSITNKGIISQLNSGRAKNLETASEIIKQLMKISGETSDETTVLMAEFAPEVKVREGEDLLLQIADMRIKKYAEWTVEYELLDITVLKSLHKKLSSAESANPAVGRCFCQLYSYIMQRYIKGQDFLDEQQKHQTASVLVEIENCCIWELLGVPQSVIKKAVEQNDYVGLLQEHSRLFGDEKKAGELPSKLNFDYRQAAEGNKRAWPITLPEPPKAKVSE